MTNILWIPGADSRINDNLMELLLLPVLYHRGPTLLATIEKFVTHVSGGVRVVALSAELTALRAERDTLQLAMDKDVVSILKGRPLVEPLHVFEGDDQLSYWKLRADLTEASAMRAIKMCELYRQISVATQRKADTAVEQASIREAKLKAERDAALVQVEVLEAAINPLFPETWRDDAHDVHDRPGLRAQRTWTAVWMGRR